MMKRTRARRKKRRRIPRSLIPQPLFQSPGNDAAAHLFNHAVAGLLSGLFQGLTTLLPPSPPRLKVTLTEVPPEKPPQLLLED